METCTSRIDLLGVYPFLKITGNNLIALNIVILCVAVAGDAKDKLWGGKFDWCDVLATCIPVMLLDIIGLICWLSSLSC